MGSDAFGAVSDRLRARLLEIHASELQDAQSLGVRINRQLAWRTPRRPAQPRI